MSGHFFLEIMVLEIYDDLLVIHKEYCQKGKKMKKMIEYLSSMFLKGFLNKMIPIKIILKTIFFLCFLNFKEFWLEVKKKIIENFFTFALIILQYIASLS